MNVIYVKIKDTSFIRIDEDILRRNFRVKGILLNTKSPFTFFFSCIKLTWFLLINIFWADIIFTRFADYHAAIVVLFSKLFRKKSFIVVGGFDVAFIPELNYGVHVKKYRSKIVRYALRNATYLLPNTEHLIKYDSDFTNLSIKGGIKQFVSKPKGVIKVIRNGFKVDFWQNTNTIKKENIAITVANIKDYRTYKLKGADFFMEVARRLPDYKFIIVGVSVDFLKRHKITIPRNLQIVEFLSHKELINYYLKAKVFCLFSVIEGMPNVLCEAMLCKCIPVGSKVTSIPEIIGETGLIIEKQNIEEMIKKTEKAFAMDENFGKLAQDRIKTNYNLEIRELELVETIKNSN